MTNPAGAKRQLLGVADPHMCETSPRPLVCWALNIRWSCMERMGLDELTLGGMTHVWETESGVTQKYVLWAGRLRDDALLLGRNQGRDS